MQRDPQPATLELYFDFVSPYAYLAWPRVRALAAARGCTLVLAPVLFAGLLESTGGVGPAEIAAKRRWLWRDVLRRATAEGIAFEGPPAHPFNPLVALRVALASGDGARQVEVVDALFTACWALGEDIATEAGVRAVLVRGGLDAEALIERAKTAETKAALRDRTAQATARGVFGVPTIIAEGELFFGQDRLADVERHLDGRGAIDEARFASILARPSAATRR